MSLWASAMVLTLCGASAGSLDALVRDLAGEDEAKRVEARQMLSREGVRLVAPLLELMKWSDPRVWRAARNVLADVAHAVCVPGREDDRETVAKAFLVFVQGKDLPVQAQREALRLLALCASDDFDLRPLRTLALNGTTREETLAALELIASDEARDVLKSLLKEGIPGARVEVIEALTSITPAPGAPVRTRLLRDDEPDIRVAAMRALAQTGSEDLIEPFEKAMSGIEGRLREEALDASLRLAEAILVRGGEAKAVKAIYARILREETGEGIRGAAVAGLIRMGDADAAKIVREAVAADTTGALEAAARMALEEAEDR